MPSEKPYELSQEYMLSLIRGGAQLLGVANARIHRLEERVERVEGELIRARAEVPRRDQQQVAAEPVAAAPVRRK